MKNSSQNQHRRSNTKRREEHKIEENEAHQIWVTTCEIAPVHHYSSCHCSHFSTVHLHFTLLLFLLQFLVSSHFILVIAFGFVFFFGNFLYTEHLYKPLSVQTINHFDNREGGRQFPRCFLFFHFLSFSFPFLSCQTPSEDENSEDGWLDRLSP